MKSPRLKLWLGSLFKKTGGLKLVISAIFADWLQLFQGNLGYKFRFFWFAGQSLSIQLEIRFRIRSSRYDTTPDNDADVNRGCVLGERLAFAFNSMTSLFRHRKKAYITLKGSDTVHFFNAIPSELDRGWCITLTSGVGNCLLWVICICQTRGWWWRRNGIIEGGGEEEYKREGKKKIRGGIRR